MRNQPNTNKQQTEYAGKYARRSTRFHLSAHIPHHGNE
jgi:hypothetical protein